MSATGTTKSVSVSTLARARKPLVEYMFDHNCLVVFLVLGAVHQCHVAAPSGGKEWGQDVWVRLELSAITLLKLGPSPNVMAKPLP